MNNPRSISRSAAAIAAATSVYSVITIACLAGAPAAAQERPLNRRSFGMGPPADPMTVAAANAAVRKPMPKGPFQTTWDSVRENYKAPAWFRDAKFGIFMNWGVYAVPAYHNEWYQKHMYGAYINYHKEHFGPQETFGYKDFIPLFTCEKFDPDHWALLFKKAGARFVVPTAQHHDNFALWDSDLTKIDAKDMGPKRDLIGDLAAAMRRQGLKFGVSNHGIENFTFINPPGAFAAELKARNADLFDPTWNDIYHFADRGEGATKVFLTD